MTTTMERDPGPLMTIDPWRWPSWAKFRAFDAKGDLWYFEHRPILPEQVAFIEDAPIKGWGQAEREERYYPSHLSPAMTRRLHFVMDKSHPKDKSKHTSLAWWRKNWRKTLEAKVPDESR